MTVEPTSYHDGDQAETIKVTLASGRPWQMPVDIAVQIIESIARAHPRTFGDHLQAALMGSEVPARRGRGGTA